MAQKPKQKSKPQPKQYRRTFIREWRKHRGDMTLETLAHAIGMVPSHLSMLERGKRGYAQETLEAIAEALQTTTAALLSRAPNDGAGDLLSLWEAASQTQREQVVEVVKAITKPRT